MATFEDMKNSVSQYFPNDQCMASYQNYAWVKDPFKM